MEDFCEVRFVSKNREGKAIIHKEDLPGFMEAKRQKGFKRFFIKKLNRDGGNQRHHHRFNLPKNQRR